MKSGTNINDAIHGLIRLTDYEKRVLSSVQFNRLHDVYQNSTVYLTFPSNRTKRFEHSIGCMYLASEMFYYSLLNASEKDLDVFFSKYSNAINHIYRGIDKNKMAQTIDWEMFRGEEIKLLYDAKSKTHFEWNKIYSHIAKIVGKGLLPHNIEKQYKLIFLILMQAVRVAALLHDVGHPPFSHIVEGALKEALTEVKTDDQTFKKESVQEFLDNISSIEKELVQSNNEFQLHEAMGVRVSASILEGLITKSTSAKINDDSISSFYEQMIKGCVLKILKDEDDFKYLHRLIDSSLDCDRLDYVMRDYRSSGINIGDMDYKRIINEMKMVVVWEDNNGNGRSKSGDQEQSRIIFSIPEKAINTVENYLKKRFDLYKDIIFHHRVVKTDMLLQDVVYKLIIKYLRGEKLFGPRGDASDSHVELPYAISGLWKLFKGETEYEKISLLSQWNDSWLMVVLRATYYNSPKNYYSLNVSDLNISKEEKIIALELSEILRNEKYFYSFIKRQEDFKKINDEIGRVIMAHRDDLLPRIKFLQEKKSPEKEKVVEGASKSSSVDPSASLDFFKLLFSTENDSEKRAQLANIFSLCMRHISAFGGDKEKFQNEVESVCREICSELCDDVKIKFKKLSDGLLPGDKQIYLYSNDKLRVIDEVSNIKRVLQIEGESIPGFYLYVVPKANQAIISYEQREEILQQIGSRIGSIIISKIENCLKECV